MKKAYTLIIVLLLAHVAMSQNLPYNPNLKPFYHGIASGDPLEDRVIIWTRVTPEQDKTIDGTYLVATDTALKNIIKTGVFSTDLNKDYTVKIDVTGLQSNTTYYYAFTALGKRSAIGRTKTTPSVSSSNLADILKFAVVTCSNYEGGYFNAYNRVADRNDLNAVIHLGDYIYEYATGDYRNIDLKDTLRKNSPLKEIVTKAEYRTRYAHYRLDKDLQRVHQQHPFIAIWDDHEIANNAYDTGAQNHQPSEGDWETRKRIAKEVYYEWVPIRGTAENSVLYRTVSYGKLVDLFMLDTRLDGRQEQPSQFDAPDDSLNPRRMISPTQFQWLINNLKQSAARWKLIGNQVVLSNFNVGFGIGNATSLSDIRFFENLFLDGWEGYVLQRNAIIDSIQRNNIPNIVFLSGDSHASWAFDVTKEPVLYPLEQFSYIPQPNPYNPTTKQGYNPETGEGSQCVEFCTPSISASNFAETLGSTALAAYFESVINKPQSTIQGNPNYNPHLKYVDLDRHGYFVLDVRADSVQADFFFVPTVTALSDSQSWGGGVSSVLNSNHITTSATLKPAPAKAIQDIPAPNATVITSVKDVAESVIFSLYPNPTSHSFNIQYGLTQTSDIDMVLVNMSGQVVQSVAQFKNQQSGVYQALNIDVSSLSKGVYLLQIRTKDAITYRKIVVN